MKPQDSSKNKKIDHDYLYLIPVEHPEDIPPKEIFDYRKITKSHGFIYRYPQPNQLISSFPNYILVHEEDIAILKRTTETLQIIPEGIYLINNEMVNPSTDYLVFITLRDFTVNWEIGYDEPLFTLSGHQLKMSGTAIIEPKDVALLAFNLILITRGLQIEFDKWFADEIRGIVIENKEIAKLVEPPLRKIPELTVLIQEIIEKELNFVGIELKGIQISNIEINGEKTIKKISTSSTIQKTKNENSIIPPSRIESNKKESREVKTVERIEKKVLLNVEVPESVIIGRPVEIKVEIAPLKGVQEEEVLVIAYSPSFLIISNEKKVLLNKKLSLKFQAVPITQFNPSITVNVFSNDGVLIEQKIINNIKIRKEVNNVLKNLLKLYSLSGIIILFYYLLAMILTKSWGNNQNAINMTFLVIGIFTGIMLSSLITLAELFTKK